MTFFSRNIKLLFICHKQTSSKKLQKCKQNCKLNRYSHNKIHLFSLPFLINNVKSSYTDKYIWSSLKSLIEMIIWHSCTLVSLLPLYDINAKVTTSYISYYIILQKKRRSQISIKLTCFVSMFSIPFIRIKLKCNNTYISFFEGSRCSLSTS